MKYIKAITIFVIILMLGGCSKAQFMPPPDTEQAAKPVVQQKFKHPEYPVKPIDKPIALPVLMYHDFTTGSARPNSTFVTTKSFDAQLKALKEAGYTTITPHQLNAFMHSRAGLPEKPVLITIDDGYESNLSLAAPILQKHGMTATVFVIGRSIGKQKDPRTDDYYSPPRFDWKEAKKWSDRGTIIIQSHTFDMHRHKSETSRRDGVLQIEGESEESYRQVLSADILLSKFTIEQNIGRELVSMSFPFGYYSDTASQLWADAGAKLLFTSVYGCSYVMPSDDFKMQHFKRWAIGDEITGEQLVSRLDGFSDFSD